MKILFLTPRLPWENDSGGKLVTNNLLRYLTANFDVTALMFVSSDRELKLEEEVKKYYKLKDLHLFVLNRKRSIINLLLSYIYRKPFPVFRNYSSMTQQRIGKLIEAYSVVVVDHYLMYQYIPSTYKGNVILHEHNAEYVLWQRARDYEANNFKKILLSIECERVKSYERKISREAKRVLCLGENDKVALERIGVSANKIDVIPAVGDEKLLERELPKFRDSNPRILFIGTLSWDPNLDGLRWFIKEGWDALREKFPDVKLLVIGSGNGDLIKKEIGEKSGVEYLGYVDDLDSYYDSSNLFIAPLRYGSGVKIKVLNAMYRGVPVVTTSIGAEGIENEGGASLAVSDSAEGIVELVAKLLESKEYWEGMQKSARQTVERNHVIENVYSKLKELVDG